MSLVRLTIGHVQAFEELLEVAEGLLMAELDRQRGGDDADQSQSEAGSPEPEDADREEEPGPLAVVLQQLQAAGYNNLDQDMFEALSAVW